MIRLVMDGKQRVLEIENVASYQANQHAHHEKQTPVVQWHVLPQMMTLMMAAAISIVSQSAIAVLSREITCRGMPHIQARQVPSVA